MMVGLEDVGDRHASLAMTELRSLAFLLATGYNLFHQYKAEQDE